VQTKKARIKIVDVEGKMKSESEQTKKYLRRLRPKRKKIADLEG